VGDTGVKDVECYIGVYLSVCLCVVLSYSSQGSRWMSSCTDCRGIGSA